MIFSNIHNRGGELTVFESQFDMQNVRHVTELCTIIIIICSYGGDKKRNHVAPK
jgi:hypothetical protein